MNLIVNPPVKKLFLSAFLLGALLFPASAAKAKGLPVTDIPRVIFEYIKTNVLMDKDEKVQKRKLEKLLETLREVKKIRARQTEQLDMDVDLDKELWKVRQFKDLKLSDIEGIAQKVLRLTNALYAHDLPSLSEYHLLKQGVPGIRASNQLYEYLQGGTSAYAAASGNAPVSYRDNLELLAGQRARQYALEVDAGHRAIHTAMTYRQLSGELVGQAVDLSDKVNRDGKWDLLGIGDLFSNLFQDATGSLPGLDGLLEGAGAQMEAQAGKMAGDIRDELGIGNDSLLEKLLDKSKDISGDISGKLQDMVKDKVASMDFLSSLTSLFSGLDQSLEPIPDYSTRIDKEGMRMTTGERIQAQAAALDNLEKSFELQLQADEMILEASQKSRAMQRLDAAYQNALIRKTLAQIPVE